MRAMVLKEPGHPLELEANWPVPRPGPREVRIRVDVCAVCRTDLHILDGELTEPKLPLVPGHQIVGEVETLGSDVRALSVGQRVGVPWLGRTCGHCWYCERGQENLCDVARFTGYHTDGGYAEYAVASEQFCFPLPDEAAPLQLAPLLCAGLIGYRCLRMVEDARRVGFYGFGAAAHILAQVARYQGREVFAFTRPGDAQSQAFARRLGAAWAGDSETKPPELLDAAILFAPVGSLVPTALGAVRKGGVVVCGGIHMSNIPEFPYSLLWEERVIRSVANLTRADGEELLALAPRVPVRTEVHPYALEDANQALDDLRHGRFEGSAVLRIGG